MALFKFFPVHPYTRIFLMLLLATITLHHITLIRQYLQITLRYIKLIICMKISFTFFKIKTLYFHIVFYYQFLMRIITAV